MHSHEKFCGFTPRYCTVGLKVIHHFLELHKHVAYLHMHIQMQKNTLWAKSVCTHKHAHTPQPFFEFPFWNTCFGFLFFSAFLIQIAVSLSVWLARIEQMDSTKSLWASVMRRPAGEDQRAAQHYLLAVKWNNTIYNESHLNTVAGWFEYKSTAITTATAARESIRLLFCRSRKSANLDAAGPSVNKQKEQSERSPQIPAQPLG